MALDTAVSRINLFPAVRIKVPIHMRFKAVLDQPRDVIPNSHPQFDMQFHFLS